MTTISLATELERIYQEPVYVWGFRVTGMDADTVKLEVDISIEDENRSKTYVEIIK